MSTDSAPLADATHAPPLRPAAVVAPNSARAAAVIREFADDLANHGWSVADLPIDPPAGADLAVAEDVGAAAEGIAEAVAARLPLLAAVPAKDLDAWIRIAGHGAVLLPAEPAALWRWWGPHRLVRDLILGVTGGVARRIVVGFNWTLVESETGGGLSHTPARGSGGCRSLPDAGRLTERSLPDLARLAASWNPFEAAIGIAAINAFYNHYDLTGLETSGLDELAGCDGPVTVIGRFPYLKEKLASHRVVERTPRDDEYPEGAAGWLLGAGDGALITAAALVDHSLAGMLERCGDATVAMVGPGTPLTPRLHAYGLHVLSGMVVADPEGIAVAIAEGGAVKAIRPHTRFVTLRAD